MQPTSQTAQPATPPNDLITIQEAARILQYDCTRTVLNYGHAGDLELWPKSRRRYLVTRSSVYRFLVNRRKHYVETHQMDLFLAH
ncbi:DNA-binding protein [Leptonema illini]|uniref:Helix-turn-helix domain-containing protein n=1 Tax=Leptonema illini DSM 21528 TaxID=929563 RepID=H2CKI9_9LEPT|nr:DNA-binding protein [Leptonema illini]EHQ08294.1 hypothetical protein Lepil_3637 [Leptonema illini DSM 21528]